MPHTHLEVIDEVAQLAPYLEFWSNQAPTPMQSPEWQLAWWAAFESLGTRLNVVVVRADDDQVIGLAPFYTRDDWTSGRTIRFLGSGRACGDFQTLLSSPAQAATVGRSIAQWLLANQRELNWSLLELEGIAEHDEAIAALTDTLRRGRCRQHSTPLEHTWRLDLGQGWTGFLARLSKTQRSQTRNLVNRFDKHSELSVRYVVERAELPVALTACMDLHQRRWQAVGEPGCFADPRFQQFVQQACDQLADNQRMCLALLEDHGVPIACQLFLHDAAGNMYMYQSGRDPHRETESIGRMLNAITVRDACAAGIGYIDFLRGNEVYKQRLGAIPSSCLRVRLVAPTLLPRLRHGLRTFSRSVKHQVDRLRTNWLQPQQPTAAPAAASMSPPSRSESASGAG